MHTVHSTVASDHFLKMAQWTSPQTPKTLPSACSAKMDSHKPLKAVKVSIADQIHEIPIFNEPVTCGWVLGQVKALHGKVGPREEGEDEKMVVAIKTENDNETLDYYLTLLDRYQFLRSF